MGMRSEGFFADWGAYLVLLHLGFFVCGLATGAGLHFQDTAISLPHRPALVVFFIGGSILAIIGAGALFYYLFRRRLGIALVVILVHGVLAGAVFTIGLLTGPYLLDPAVIAAVFE